MKVNGLYQLLMTPTVAAVDMAKETKRKNIEVSGVNEIVMPGTLLGESTDRVRLDFNDWLPYAAKKYNISSDIRDYVIQPTPTLPADIPNRNGVAFPLPRMVEFMPDYGMQAYKTFKGKPTFTEHDNQDHTKAKGVILDVSMRRIEGYGRGHFWVMHGLLAFDRTRDPQLANAILSGERNAVSMGAYTENYSCSYCSALIGDCDHLHPKEPLDFYALGNYLVYRQVTGFCGFETSSVATPAYSSACNNLRFDPQTNTKRNFIYT